MRVTCEIQRRFTDFRAWSLNLCPLLYTRWQSHWHLDSLHELQGLAPEHLGSCTKPSGAFLSPLVYLPVKPCGSWGRDHSKFYRIWKPNIILVRSFNSSNIFSSEYLSMIRERQSFVSKVFAVYPKPT